MDQDSDAVRAQLRVRVGQETVHYGEGIVAGAFLVGLLGDLATEITIQTDQNEGLLRAYERVEFLQPVRAGDYLEAEAELVARGNTSRTIEFRVYRVAEAINGESTARTLPDRPLVAQARGTTVVHARKKSVARQG